MLKTQDKENQLRKSTQKIRNLQERISIIKGRAKTRRSALNKKISKLKRKIKVLKQLNGNAGGLKKKVQSLEAQVAKLSEEKNILETTVVNLNQQIQTLTGQKTALEAQVTALNTNLSTKNKEIANLTSQLDEKVSQVTGLELDKAELSNNLSQVQTKRDALLENEKVLNEKITSLEDSIISQTKEIQTLKESNESLLSSNSSLSVQINSLEKKITELEGKEIIQQLQSCAVEGEKVVAGFDLNSNGSLDSNEVVISEQTTSCIDEELNLDCSDDGAIQLANNTTTGPGHCLIPNKTFISVNNHRPYNYSSTGYQLGTVDKDAGDIAISFEMRWTGGPTGKKTIAHFAPNLFNAQSIGLGDAPHIYTTTNGVCVSVMNKQGAKQSKCDNWNWIPLDTNSYNKISVVLRPKKVLLFANGQLSFTINLTSSALYKNFLLKAVSPSLATSGAFVEMRNFKVFNYNLVY